jgi:superfamily II DNA or RNA helicase
MSSSQYIRRRKALIDTAADKPKKNLPVKATLKSKSKSKCQPPANVEFTLSDEYKTYISSNSYLGKKGYTIPKEVISPPDLACLYKELHLVPTLSGPSYGTAPDASFPVYRESSKKIYIPRFYGISRYGLPVQSEVPTRGKEIEVVFAKPLRDYQNEIVDIYMSHVNLPICLNDDMPLNHGNGGILEVKTGKGKTVIALKIISNMRQKTLIIVHKEFLADQWKERIDEFLPGAKVGRIQGNIFDVEGKDIVIGMVQTLYNRDFPDNAFSEFGLTIVDEVHRIGSEEFSKTLLRIVTPNMMGISATVDRKDGLEKLLYMFIGPKIYKDESKSDDPVCVRAIEYSSQDEEFNLPILDYRGNPMFSSMISKLCHFSHRSDFIVRVLADLIIESPDSQIMILAHQRNILSYLHEAIVYNKIATVGYYVGGTKQAVLKETEEKQIVLATFSMAAEALDIKTLSTLFMVTPKSDIVQSVGRILRAKHETPIIVDLVDSHSIFKNQFNKRRQFYKKNNYRIRSVPMDKYTGFKDMSHWHSVFEPRNVLSGEKPEVDTHRTSLIQGVKAGTCMVEI